MSWDRRIADEFNVASASPEDMIATRWAAYWEAEAKFNAPDTPQPTLQPGTSMNRAAADADARDSQRAYLAETYGQLVEDSRALGLPIPERPQRSEREASPTFPPPLPPDPDLSATFNQAASKSR